MGYFIKRVSPLLGIREVHLIKVAGILFFILDIISAYFGFERADPSYNWMITTVATFIAIDRLKISSDVLSKAIEWSAKRSYSIYLLQYTTIEFAISIVYATALNGGYATLAWPLRLLTWLLATTLAYGLALAIASLVDTLIIGPIQSTIRQHRLKFYDR